MKKVVKAKLVLPGVHLSQGEQSVSITHLRFEL